MYSCSFSFFKCSPFILCNSCTIRGRSSWSPYGHLTSWCCCYGKNRQNGTGFQSSLLSYSAVSVGSTSKLSSVKCLLQRWEYLVAFQSARVLWTSFFYLPLSTGSLANLKIVTLSLVEFEQPASTHLYTILGLTAAATLELPVWYRCFIYIQDTAYGPRVMTYSDHAPFQP